MPRQLWVKQWGRCKEHIGTDKRPYNRMLNDGKFMPRFTTPTRVLKMKMRQLLRDVKD
jgi:hypothetical protein